VNEELKDLIKELYSIKQMFQSYLDLSKNPSFRFDGKIYHKTISKSDRLIQIARLFLERRNK